MSRAPSRFRALIPVMAAALAAGLLAAPALGATNVKVYFARDDRLQTVQRTVPTGARPVDVAVGALFAGPSAAERRDGIRSAIPGGVTVGEIVLADGLAFVRVPETFAAGGTGDAVELRLAQIAHTVTGAADVGGVRLLLGDEPVPAAGEDPGAVITLTSLRKREIIGPVPVGTAQVQRRLIQLRYLPAGAASGRLDYRTSQALMAFQGYEGLTKSGRADIATRSRLNRARIPRPRVATQARRIEVTRARGVALLIEKGQIVRAIHVSTGAGGVTPRGTFRIFRKERMSWSYPFSSWLPYASYFQSGYAFHEYPSVPPFPASHGCIRIGYPEAPFVFGFARFGTVVNVV